MDTQPWDYWEAGGAKPKGRGAEIVSNLERCSSATRRTPARSTSTSTRSRRRPRRSAALPHAERLGRADARRRATSCTCRRTSTTASASTASSLDINKRAIAVDERYFRTSPSDPLYKSAYYPHNIHFVMVSAQMGGDGATAIDAAKKLDAAVPRRAGEAVPDHGAGEGGAVHDAARSSPSPTRCSRSPAPDEELVLVRAMYHYARAVALRAQEGRGGRAAPRSTRSPRSRRRPTSSRTTRGACRRKEIVQTARLVATGRLADAAGRPRRRGQGLRGRDRDRGHAAATPSRRTGTTRCASRSAACACARAGSTTPSARSAIRSRACATTAGRSPASPRSTRARATQRRDGGARAYAKAWFGPAGGPDLARL